MITEKGMKQIAKNIGVSEKLLYIVLGSTITKSDEMRRLVDDLDLVFIKGAKSLSIVMADNKENSFVELINEVDRELKAEEKIIKSLPIT